MIMKQSSANSAVSSLLLMQNVCGPNLSMSLTEQKKLYTRGRKHFDPFVLYMYMYNMKMQQESYLRLDKYLVLDTDNKNTCNIVL